MTTDTSSVKAALATQRIETPSWAYGNSGTRFKVFGQPGVPRNAFEKVADAAQVHRHTGVAPAVALHIPWDKVDDYGDLARHAADLGVRLGTINSGPPRTPPGKSRRLFNARLGPEQRIVLEYKLFEPAFYTTDVPDWGTAYVHCAALGDRAVVCLDTGHHAPSTNIEFIVAQLLRLGKLGSFDFNSRFYADDDLIVGAADPFQLFRIMVEVIRGGGYDGPTPAALMLDQCHNIEKKVPGQIRSGLNVQEMVARALLLDTDALAVAQREGDVLAASQIYMDAFYTD